MSALQQDSYKDERIVCPLIILSERGSKVLTARGPERLCLPSVSVPARVRLAASLTSAVAQALGLRTVHSLSIPSSSDRAAYRVMECTAGDDLFSAAYEWKPA